MVHKHSDCVQSQNFKVGSANIMHKESLPQEWIPGTILFLITFIITLKISLSEIKKRKKSNVTFVTKSLQYVSLMSMITALLANLCYILRYFNGFCIFSTLLANILLLTQAIFLGFYQLSRLYYCFSNKNIHSNKGYPKWLFIVMISIGVSLIINSLFISIIYNNQPYVKCGINAKFEFYYVTHITYTNKYLSLWPAATGIIFLLWDITTLSLYYYKIRSLRDIIKNKDENIYKRVLSILNRIFILTLFYQLSTAIVAVFAVIINLIIIDIVCVQTFLNNLGVGIFSVAVCISMYLMMDHNKNEYIKFLRFVKRSKLHWICCKCRKIVIQQLLELDDATVLAINIKRKTNMDETNLDTKDMSVPEALSIPAQLSEVTMTEH